MVYVEVTKKIYLISHFSRDHNMLLDVNCYWWNYWLNIQPVDYPMKIKLTCFNDIILNIDPIFIRFSRANPNIITQQKNIL